MKISAWKCEKTGLLFEQESEYRTHLDDLRKKEQCTLALPELQKELELVQTSLTEVKSVKELVVQLVPAYAAALKLLVRHGMTSTDEANLRLIRIETASLELGPIDPDAAMELNVDPYSTRGVAGALEFVFAGPIAPSEALSPVRLFPLLQGGRKTPFVFNPCTSSKIGDFWHFTAYIFVFIDQLPHLKPLLDEFIRIGQNELPDLRSQQACEEARLRSVDEVVLRASQEKAAVDEQVRTLFVTRERLEKTLKDRAQQLSAAAVENIPRLSRYYELMETLCIC
jgi:hypothetical protein